MPSLRFDRFSLDPDDRRLLSDGVPVEVNARYLDALVLLVCEQGRLVTKDRFMDEVWRGVPVTDEALTQCIRTLRRLLGDDAARPRFIETVPKHGYRFIAAIDAGAVPVAPVASTEARDARRRAAVTIAIAGTGGGAIAGVIGGLAYGFLAASLPLQPAVGAVSVLLVLLCVTLVIALIGAAGVSIGVALAELAPVRPAAWRIVGGAAGGLAVGAVVKLLAHDGFSLLLGVSPGAVTGGGEGALLGGAVGLGAWLTAAMSARRSAAVAGAIGAVAGMAIALLGGRLLGGSLALLASGFPAAHLRLGQIGGLFGEGGFGPVSLLVTGALEGALFSAGVVGAMTLARQRLRRVITSR